MIIIRKNQINDMVVTVSMNKTLPSPYYLFSFQHIASKERVSFIPETIVSNTRYDKFRFRETTTTDLTQTPPNVNFEYLGQYYYSIYEQISSGNTNPALAYNKLEEGRAVVIVGDAQTDVCWFEPYISDDENFANIIYVSDQEEECFAVTPTNTPTPSITPTNTPTPTQTGTPTPTPTCPITTQYLEVQLSENTSFKLILWNDIENSNPANALCDYIISGTAYGSLGTVYTGTETITTGQHQHQFNLAPVLQPGEIVESFQVLDYTTNGCVCPVNLILSNTICPNRVIISNFSNDNYNGTYERLYSYSGGSLDYGYLTLIAGNLTFYPNTEYGGNKFTIFGKIVGSNYQLLIRVANTNLYVLVISTGDYVINGGTLISGLPIVTNQTQVFNTYTYPESGLSTNNVLVTYPANCY